MKKVVYLFCLTLLGISFSCKENDGIIREKVVLNVNEPVFITAQEFRSIDIQVTSPQPIEQQGKLCLYEGYLYISEPGKGIHIIDNRNPSSPKSVGFIELEGNADIAARDNKLYADTFIDLVWFDISNPAQPQYRGRLENAFKYAVPPADNEEICEMEAYYSTDKRDKVIVGWKLTKKEYTYEYYANAEYMMDSSPGVNSSGGASNGVNGSMSRFSMYKGYLYSVMNNMMTIIDLSAAEPVKAVDDMPVDWNVETIFYYNEHMFLGTPTGMSIYSVEKPTEPKRMSTVWHLTGCDPVVVEDDIAYVTIHAGNFCGANNNQLIIYDVSDVTSPRHLVSYAMTKPKGLGIDNSTLFICDDGLKVFNAKEPQTLMANQLAHYSGMEGYDLIPYKNVLMMIADDGLYQYDYSDVNKISQLSKITIRK